MRKPYLIQRATIITPEFKIRSFIKPDTLCFDYMGAAEFEYNSKPRALSFFKDMKDFLKIVKHPKIINNDNKALFILSNLNETDLNTYYEYLVQLRENKISLKCSSRFQNVNESTKTDFWWDIQNNVMWSFDEDFMKTKLISYLTK